METAFFGAAASFLFFSGAARYLADGGWQARRVGYVRGQTTVGYLGGDKLERDVENFEGPVGLCRNSCQMQPCFFHLRVLGQLRMLFPPRSEKYGEERAFEEEECCPGAWCKE